MQPRFGQGRGGRPWRRLREIVLLRDNYTCQYCKRVCLIEDLECDHKTPLAKGGTDTAENLQALCKRCHEVKTAKDCGIKLRVEIGLDGWPST